MIEKLVFIVQTQNYPSRRESSIPMFIVYLVYATSSYPSFFPSYATFPLNFLISSLISKKNKIIFAHKVRTHETAVSPQLGELTRVDRF